MSFLAITVVIRTFLSWSMASRMQSDLVLQALLMAVWRRRPNHEVIVHSDQGSQ
jgi:putative transposase